MKFTKTLFPIFIFIGVFIVAGSAGECHAKEYRYINIATASMGGTFYPLGGGMADVLSKNLNELLGYRVSASIQATGGSAENIRLVHRGRAELALANGSSAYEGYHGVGVYEKTGKQEVAAIFAVYPSPVQLATLDSTKDIQGIMDIKGKKIAVGPPGSGTENDVRNIIDALNIGYDDFDQAFLSFGEMSMSLRDNVIDAAFHTAGLPVASLVDLSTTRKIRLIEFKKQELEKIFDSFPYYFEFEIPADTYRGVSIPIRTIQTPVVLICHPEMPEDVVYKITKTLYENRKRLVEVHSSAKWIQKDFMSNSPIPFHPGAEKYLKEIGVLK